MAECKRYSILGWGNVKLYHLPNANNTNKNKNLEVLIKQINDYNCHHIARMAKTEFEILNVSTGDKAVL